ncbi:MAG: CBS domain-containing protein, partial [Acidimicrobiia bacterium]
MRESSPQARAGWSVLWTRGKGCAELAETLAGEGTAARVSGDLVDACVSARADLVVGRRMASSFDLVSLAVPYEFAREKVRGVVAAVSGGPHSTLAVRVAERLGTELGVPATLISAFRVPPDRPAALMTLELVGRAAPGLSARAIQADSAAGLVGELREGSLLVLGAPGGSLIQRLFLGPGARLRARAPAGAVVVSQAPRRVYQLMSDPDGVSPLLRAADARRLITEPVPVVSEGRPVGLFRPDEAAGMATEAIVADLMEEPATIESSALIAEARSLMAGRGHAPLAVVDRRGDLIGCLRWEDL